MELMVGSLVNTLPPFQEAFPSTYPVLEIREDGTVLLGGIEGSFDPGFLVVVG